MPMLLRLSRGALLVAVVVLIHQQARWFEQQRGSSISLRTARKYFSAAQRVQLRDLDRGLHFVTDARGDTIGCLLTTSPHTDGIIGYSGPNNLLIALDARGAIQGMELLRSGDTEEHVAQVKRDSRFWRSFVGWRPGEAPPPRVEAVSGATLTSLAIAEAVQQRLAGATPSLRFPDPITLSEIQALFTNCVRMTQERARWRAFDSGGRTLGYMVRTSPQADNVSGYRGPTECLVALGPDGQVIEKVHVRKSYDTDSYVNQLRLDKHFLNSFVGRTLDELAALDFKNAKIEGVSGATQTSFAAAEGMKRRAAMDRSSTTGRVQWRPKARDVALAGIVAGAMVMSFTSLRGHRWIRLGWQLLLVGYLGLVSHDMISLALLGGWAAGGMAWRTAPGLVLLAGAALFVPWAGRRQLYCHHLCPHGAAQQLLSRLGCRHWKLPQWLQRRLESVPGILLAVGFLIVLLGLPLSLVHLEAFDAWAWRTAGAATLTIAGIGLVASIFIPQAYCRFGCPTGALLGFLRSAGSADRWGRRDWLALVLVGLGVLAVIGVRGWPRQVLEPEPTAWTGRTMGTTWTVKTFEEVGDPGLVEQTITNEFEWAESLTSHWRTNTDLSRFNSTPETNAMPVPWPVVTLVRWSAEISQESNGAYDATVGPLVKLWGFGPAAPRSEPPSDREIEAVRPAVGWQTLGVEDGMLRKAHPHTEVDLSSIAKGWAIDRVSRVLLRRGYTNLLVEAGGEVRASGRWNVAIEHPTRTCVLSNESLATSGTYRQNYRPADTQRPYSHLIDPRSGRPITHNTVSVSVRHAECAKADAWATALNVLGLEQGMPLAERLDLAAQFVTEDAGGKLIVRQTPAWRARDVANGVR